MTPTQRKPWASSALHLLALALLTGITGCERPEKETWYCYDALGHPLEGVVIACNYGLPNYDKSGMNCRFSDASGRIVLDLDKDIPNGLRRGFSCIYSAKLRSGNVGMGERWHGGEPIPDTAVYFDEWNNKIYLKNGFDDPVAWAVAVNGLTAAYGNAFFTAGEVPGAVKMEKALEKLAPRERDLFIAQYGELEVPWDEIKRRRLQGHFKTPRKDAAGMKFKDIIDPLRKERWKRPK
ncbi:MAG: hypothetical protein ABI600_12015 [Luteolibacter sp.]